MLNPLNPFAHSDRSIYDIYIANRAGASLAVAVRLGLFDLLAIGPLNLGALCERFGFQRRPLDAFLTVLVSLGLLERSGEGAGGPLEVNGGPLYSLTPLASEHLRRDAPFYMGGLIDLENEHFVTPQNLMEAMRRNKPVAYGDLDPWDALVADPKAAVDFTRAMHSISVRPAFGLAAVFDFSSSKSLLDAGGGSGILSIAALLRNPGLRATVLELPVISDVAREMAVEYGVADRLDVITGNMFKDPLPGGSDAILFSQIFHDWRPEHARLLLAKAHTALPAGGRVLIHEKLLNDDRDGPLATALVSVDMLFWTEGQQYSASELRQLLGETGFVRPRTVPTVGYWSVTWAEKG